MAPRVKKGGKNDPQIYMKQLWQQIAPEQWVTYLNSIHPQGAWTLQGRDSIKGLCPWHNEDTPSLHINITKQYGTCFGCGHNVTNPVQLVAKLLNTNDVAIALNSVITYFDLSTKIPVAVRDEITEYHRYTEMKKEAAIGFNAVLDKIYINNGVAPKGYEYCQEAYDYLSKTRGLSMNNNRRFQLGIFLQPEHMRTYISQQYFSLYEEYFSPVTKNASWLGSIIFYYNDNPNSISIFRVRKPNMDGRKEIMAFPDKYATTYGLFGIYSYRNEITRDLDVYITEGEFDVLSVVNEQMNQGRPDFIVLATGGKMSSNLATLRGYDINTVYLVPDAPVKSGDQWALNIIKDSANYTYKGGEAPYNILVYKYSPKLLGNDLDEIMHQNDYLDVKDQFLTKRSFNFLSILEYIRHLCSQELTPIDLNYKAEIKKIEFSSRTAEEKEIAVSGLTQSYNLTVKDIVRKWLVYLPSTEDKKVFLTKFGSELELDMSDVPITTGSLLEYNSVEGMVSLLSAAFSEFYSVSYYEQKTSSQEIHIWNKAKQLDMTLNPNAPESILTTLSFTVGWVVEWIQKLFPNNPLIYEKTEKLEPLEKNERVRRNVLYLLKAMLEKLLPNIPEINKLTTCSQGIHHSILPERLREDNVFYFVNGCNIFRGAPNEKNIVIWERVTSNVDRESVLFHKLGDSEKWSFVNSVDDLNLATRVDLRNLYFKVLDIVSTWNFTNNEIIAPFLAAYIISLPVQTALGSQQLTFITGDPESGKTTLLQALLGGMQNIRQNAGCVTLIESARYIVEASTASIFQKFHKTSLALCLDETEETSKHNTKSDMDKREILRGLYNIATGGGHRERGTPDGSVTKTFSLVMPVLIAGINPPKDSVLLTRTLMIHTKKKLGYKNVVNAILEKYSSEEITQIRHDITLGLLPHLVELKRIEPAFRRQLTVWGRQVATTSERFINCIAMPLLILNYISPYQYPPEFKHLADLYPEENLQPEILFKKILIAYKDYIEAIHSQQGHSDLLYTCLYTPGITTSLAEGGTGLARPSDLILEGGARDTVVNRSGVGIYVERDIFSEPVVLFHWRKLKYGNILRNTSYSSYEIPSLIELVDRNPSVVEITPDLLVQIQNKHGADIASREVTAVKLSFVQQTNKELLEGDKK